MSTSETRQFAGRNCWITCTDELGQIHNKIVKVESLQYVPLYGAYVIGDTADVFPDRRAHIPPFE